MDADPSLLAKAADFLISNGQHDKAADLLITAGKYEEAIELCVNHQVEMTEERAERLTLPKSEDEAHMERRRTILEKVADCCLLQENYAQATRNYTQAGDKLKAMRALLKSGETSKIIYFASKCRQKEIYYEAANYLQCLDWASSPEGKDIKKNIVTFYTKAKALDSLARFYEESARYEIDE